MSQLPILYLNENVAVPLVELLMRSGIKAIHTYEVKNGGKSDEFQLEYASSKNYIVLTHNRNHFKQLHQKWIAQGRRHSGIIVVRMGEPEQLAMRVQRFFESVYPTVNPPFCLSPPQ